MARGWESKAVEDQVAEAELRKQAVSRRKFTAAEIEHREQLTNLQLLRSRMLDQINQVKSEAHRKFLQQGLDEIESQMKVLEK